MLVQVRCGRAIGTGHGASTGIGRATALRLDGLGWRVFAGVRREEDGEALRKAGSRIEPLMLDVTDVAANLIAVERGWDQEEGVIEPKSRAGRRAVPYFPPCAAI